MADQISADLIEAQRAHWEADARVQAATEAMPSSVAVLTGEAEVSQEQRDELEAARKERLRLAAALYAHLWSEQVDDPRKARQKAAQA